jgi:photosystem II stability/assembly factor-like uncharacterized protein
VASRGMLRPLTLLQIAATLWSVAALSVADARAHDPSAYGGLFRSRNFGETWLNADTGLFINAALTVAIDPRDPAHLLFGTDVGLLSTRSGGRAWKPAAADLVVGAVFAVAFSADGSIAAVAAPSGVFRSAGEGWTRAAAPAGAVPARAIAFGAEPGRVYLLGADGLFVSRDAGASYVAVTGAPLAGPMTAIAVATQPREIVFAVTGSRLFASRDGGTTWQDVGVAGRVDAVSVDGLVAERVWANAGDRILASDDAGRTWRPVGTSLPEPGTTVRGIAADPPARSIVVTTHRGTYRSEDGGMNWELKEGNLPIHLEAGPLVRDPADAASLYAVYSLLPYPEAWRTAVEGSNLLSRTDPVGLASGLAFLLLLLVLGALLVRWLAGRRAPVPRTAV